MKYDKVVEMNQKIGKQNARIVEKEIERMIENGEKSYGSSITKIYWIFKFILLQK